MRKLVFAMAAAAVWMATPAFAKEGAWFKELEAECSAGKGISCKILGNQLDHAYFGAAEPANARAAYERGCKLKEEQACVGLYRMLVLGRGGPQDLARAAQYEAVSCHKDQVVRYDYRAQGLCKE